MLHYKIYGEGSPVLILHGLFGTLDNWKSLSSRLSDHYRVIMVDLRNHGRSFWSEEFNYDLMVQDIVSLLNHMNIDCLDVIGHSMGGKVAMSLGAAFPERVQKIVVIDIAPKKYPPGHKEIFEAVLAMKPEAISSRIEANDILKESISNFPVRQFLLKSLTRRAEGGYRWRTNFQSLYNNYNTILNAVDISNLAVPVIFIRGSKSNYVTEEDTIALESTIKQGEIVTLNAGHWLHVEQPKELFEAIVAFLD